MKIVDGFILPMGFSFVLLLFKEGLTVGFLLTSST